MLVQWFKDLDKRTMPTEKFIPPDIREELKKNVDEMTAKEAKKLCTKLGITTVRMKSKDVKRRLNKLKEELKFLLEKDDGKDEWESETIK